MGGSGVRRWSRVLVACSGFATSVRGLGAALFGILFRLFRKLLLLLFRKTFFVRHDTTDDVIRWNESVLLVALLLHVHA